jgi:hypothetical protein
LSGNHLLLQHQLTFNALQFLVLTTVGWRSDLAGVARKLRAEYPGAIYHLVNQSGGREGTVVTVAWIADRLGLGDGRNVSNRLPRWRKGVFQKRSNERSIPRTDLFALNGTEG